jgi:hypothetical protein
VASHVARTTGGPTAVMPETGPHDVR